MRRACLDMCIGHRDLERLFFTNVRCFTLGEVGDGEEPSVLATHLKRDDVVTWSTLGSDCGGERLSTVGRRCLRKDTSCYSE